MIEAAADPPAASRGRFAWHVPLGIAVSLGFLYLAVRHLDWAAFFGYLRRISTLHVAAAAAITTSAYLLRGLRWRFFFPRDERPTWWDSERVLLVGFAGNNILPARAGEVLRAHFMGRLSGLSRTRVLATVLLERAFDALSLVLLLMVALPVMGRRLPHLEGVAWLGAILLALFPGGFVVARWQGRARVGRIAQFLRGLDSLGNYAALGGIASLSLVIWLLDTGSVWMTMRAFAPMGWDAALAVTVFGNIGTMIPSGPAAVGTWEYAVCAVLAPWGMDPAMAFGMALVIHLLQFVLTTAGGGLSWAALLARAR